MSDEEESFVILGSSSLAPSLVDRDDDLELDTPGSSLGSLGRSQRKREEAEPSRPTAAAKTIMTAPTKEDGSNSAMKSLIKSTVNGVHPLGDYIMRSQIQTQSASENAVTTSFVRSIDNGVQTGDYTKVSMIEPQMASATSMKSVSIIDSGTQTFPTVGNSDLSYASFIIPKLNEYIPSIVKPKKVASSGDINATVSKLQMSLNETANNNNGKKYANKTTQSRSFPQTTTKQSFGSGGGGGSEPIINGGANNSLAASFILGDINADVLKTSVYSQFPSLCSMEACAEDLIKLQTIMTEYLEIKNTLAKVNATMKQFYIKTQQWKAEMTNMEANYKQQLSSCETQIATLRNENLELKREIETKIEHMQYVDENRQKEHAELVQNVSDKSSQITNLSNQIEKLEQQQLASYEYVAKNANDSKEKPDYIVRLEHQRIVKEFERQMSQMLAENLDLKDVQKQYSDEITCLKVNLTASEELIKQLRADINLLKANDIEKSELFTAYERERDQMREELQLMRQQVDVYSKDFEMERTARQGLAGEKDQLLQDLRLLQRKNQELIEQAQKQWDKIMQSAQNAAATTQTFTAATTATAFEATSSAQRPIRALPTTTAAACSSSNSTNTSPTYSCPICHVSFRALNALQTHVNACLDRT